MTGPNTGRPRPGSADNPVIGFVGRSGSGKTTLLESVIAELAARGLRVAVIKHHGHTAELDVPRKDSWRHAQAGAVTTVVSGPAQVAMVRRAEREATLAELLALVGDADVVLAEGFREQAGVCIEVLRAANGTQLVCAPESIAALATDVPLAELPEALRARVESGETRLFTLDDGVVIAAAIASGEVAPG